MSEIKKYLDEGGFGVAVQNIKDRYSPVNHSHTYNEVGADKSGAANEALTNAYAYTDEKTDALNDDITAHVEDSTIHVTTSNKTQWNAGYTHSTSAHAPSNAERNVIVGIQKNGTDIDVDSSTRKVNITVPTKASDVGADESGSASSALTSAKSYTDSSVKVVQDGLTEHIADNDIHFTAAERIKLAGIASGAQVNTITGIKGNAESSYRTGNVNITPANIGLGNVNNTSDINKPVSTAQQTAIDSALSSAKSYTDNQINAIVGEGASDTLNTIGEISQAIEAHQDVTDALNAAIGNKANSSDLTSHTSNTTIHITADERTQWNQAEANQNAFGNVSAGGVTIVADSETDTLTIASGTGISVSGDATNDKVTIANSGVRSISTGSTNGTISVNTNGSSANVSVKGLGSAAYTASTDYDPAGSADTALEAANTYTDEVAEGKSNIDHTHKYAGSSSVGGSATSAVKLDTSTAGSATQPVYFTGGKPSACTYSLNKTVPSDAVFTDTVYTHPSYTARTGVPTANQTPAFGGTFQITQPVSDASGHITGMNSRTITIPNTVASTSAPGLCPKRGDTTTKFLRDDGTWAVPPDTDTVYTHPASGATAGSYGDSANQTPAYGGTFKVPYVTVDANGHVTGISAHTVKIPASDNSDTKNTAGSTNSSSKLFLIGATSQGANPQTYSHDTAYVGTDGHLYSDSKQVVNLSGSQALTNKTYNGYTLAAACAKGVVTSIASGNTNLPTSGAVYTAMEDLLGDDITSSDINSIIS